jgi:general secretion pathway protein D
LQLKDGETQIMGGLIDNESRNTANRVPGLGQLPGVGRLFSTQGDNGVKTEIILSITPHIVGKPRHAEARDVQYWSGTEATLRARPIQARTLTAPGGVPAPVVVSSAPEVAAVLTKQQATLASKLPAPAIAPIPASMQMSTELTPPATETSPPAAPALSLSWSAPKELRVGDKLTVPLEGRVTGAATGLEFQIGYETSMLRLLNVEPGTLVSANKFSQTPNETSGAITIGLSDAGEAGVSGRLATLEFEVIGSSTASRLTLTPAGSAILPPPALTFSAQEAPTENAP